MPNNHFSGPSELSGIQLNYCVPGLNFKKRSDTTMVGFCGCFSAPQVQYREQSSSSGVQWPAALTLPEDAEKVSIRRRFMLPAVRCKCVCQQQALTNHHTSNCTISSSLYCSMSLSQQNSIGESRLLSCRAIQAKAAAAEAVRAPGVRVACALAGACTWCGPAGLQTSCSQAASRLAGLCPRTWQPSSPQQPAAAAAHSCSTRCSSCGRQHFASWGPQAGEPPHQHQPSG